MHYICVAFRELLDRTPIRDLVYFIASRLTFDSLQYLDSDAVDIFTKEWMEWNIEIPRWISCIQKTAVGPESEDGYLVHLAASLYAENHSPEQSAIDDVTELVQQIRKSYVDMINNSEWMDDATKVNAVKKAENMVDQIGFPGDLLTEDLYPNVDIKQDKFFQNVLNIRKYNADSNRVSRLKPFAFG